MSPIGHCHSKSTTHKTDHQWPYDWLSSSQTQSVPLLYSKELPKLIIVRVCVCVCVCVRARACVIECFFLTLFGNYIGANFPWQFMVQLETGGPPSFTQNHWRATEQSGAAGSRSYTWPRWWKYTMNSLDKIKQLQVVPYTIYTMHYVVKRLMYELYKVMLSSNNRVW